MSHHDALEAAVLEQRARYKKELRRVQQAMELLHRAMPKFFGGNERHYYPGVKVAHPCHADTSLPSG